jgi:hypothetical protein
MKEKRGIVKVSSALMFDFEVMKVFYSEFFPFKIDYDYLGTNPAGVNIGIFNCYGCCERFDEIKEGDPLPQYEFTFLRNDEGIISIKDVEKVK